MENDLDMYMENLDEFINDENKVVTYRWLSVTLKLSCDAAKRLLNHYACSRKASETLHVTYLVIGQDTTKDDHETKVCIVPQSRLEKTKQSMCSVSCVHVYSLSKSQLPDMVGALYATDYDSIRQNLRQSSKYGGIVCSESTQRSQEDLDSFRSKGTYLPSTPQDTRNAPDPRLAKPTHNSPSKSGKPINASNIHKNKASAKGSLESMFAAQKPVKKEVKQEPDDEEKDTKSTSGKTVAPAAKKQNGISNFLKNGVDPRESKPKLPARVTRSSPRKAEVKDEDVATIEDEADLLPKSPKKSPPRKTYGRGKAKPVTQPSRSRILKIDSDSSDEEDAARASEDEEEEPIPPSPPPAVSDEDPEPVPTSSVRRSRGVKRKTIDRAFETENGFLLTTKEVVDVTDSESEETVAPPPKKQNLITSPAKAAPEKSSKTAKMPQNAKKNTKTSPVKSKQSSILSFFKKK